MTGNIHRRRLIAVGIIAAVGLTGCSTGDDDSADEPASDDAFTEMAAEEPADEAAMNDAAGAASPTAGTVAPNAADLDLGIVGRDVIIEMHVVLSSEDIGRSVASISASASQLGGGVASSSVDYGVPTVDDRPGHAVLVVKVPPDQLDRLLSGLDATGTVRSIEQSAQDVTEQLVDLDVRIENARESVANVRDFMEQATDLNQLVTLESELTFRQTELERLEAQQRNLSERVALSTVTIEVVPTSSIPEVADDNDESLGDAVSDGWRAFATFLFAVVYVLAVLMPFLIVAGMVGAIGWLVVRHRRRRNDDTTGDDTTGDDTTGENQEQRDDELTGVGSVTADGTENRPE